MTTKDDALTAIAGHLSDGDAAIVKAAKPERLKKGVDKLVSIASNDDWKSSLRKQPLGKMGTTLVLGFLLNSLFCSAPDEKPTYARTTTQQAVAAPATQPKTAPANGVRPVAETKGQTETKPQPKAEEKTQETAESPDPKASVFVDETGALVMPRPFYLTLKENNLKALFKLAAKAKTNEILKNEEKQKLTFAGWAKDGVSVSIPKHIWEKSIPAAIVLGKLAETQEEVEKIEGTGITALFSQKPDKKCCAFYVGPDGKFNQMELVFDLLPKNE